MKNQFTVQNIGELVETIYKITNTKANDISLVILDAKTDLWIGSFISQYKNQWKPTARIVTLNNMGISSIKLASELLSKNSRAIVVTEDTNATVCLLSNTPKDNKISKYIFGKSFNLHLLKSASEL